MESYVLFALYLEALAGLRDTRKRRQNGRKYKPRFCPSPKMDRTIRHVSAAVKQVMDQGRKSKRESA